MVSIIMVGLMDICGASGSEAILTGLVVLASGLRRVGMGKNLDTP